MRKTLLTGILAILLIPIALLADWAYYHDKKPFIAPVHYVGKLPVRNDYYGDGHFGAPRKGGRSHKGLDIYAPLHSEVRASKGGRVSTNFQNDGMGNYAMIIHPKDYITLYGHLAEFRVKNNERVRQGSVIGLVGKTGNAKYSGIKPHIHFEIRKGGKHLDPLLYLLHTD